ncbi:disease resistance protein (CC-NBS-LRR class) family protein, partial [Trifolium medium]|nr:disease resistance protein (CC-NBS-LRR class) family protein [Trifolium medium]
MTGGEVNLDHPPLPQFRGLSQLIINKCPKLIDLPTFQNVEELQLCESMVKPLKETLDMASSSSSTPLSLLKTVWMVKDCEGYDDGVVTLPSRMCDMPSLEHIKIMGCHNLESLPKEMDRLT